MGLELKKAQRKRVKLKIGMSAPAGGGKTASSLILAYGLLKGEHKNQSDAQIWDKIALIDTENGSGELYSNATIGGTEIGEYYVIGIEPPFEPQKLIQALDACEEAGIEVVITDSLSHYWAGQGGMLDKQANITKRTNNSYAAWRDITPLHNQMIDKILQCNMHVISTMRSKTEYVQEKDDKGKTTVRKIGLAPVIRDGVEFEYSIFLEIDANHQAYAAKDRTSVIDGQYFTVTPDTGIKLAKWLDGGAEIPKEVAAKPKKPQLTPEEQLAKGIELIDAKAREAIANGVEKEKVSAVIEGACGIKNYKKINSIETAKATYDAICDLIGGKNNVE